MRPSLAGSSGRPYAYDNAPDCPITPHRPRILFLFPSVVQFSGPTLLCSWLDDYYQHPHGHGRSILRFKKNIGTRFNFGCQPQGKPEPYEPGGHREPNHQLAVRRAFPAISALATRESPMKRLPAAARVRTSSRSPNRKSRASINFSSIPSGRATASKRTS